MTEVPFKEAEQQELNFPALLFEEHNKERVLRSADVSSLFTQGMVKVRGITMMRKERRDMEEEEGKKQVLEWKKHSVTPIQFGEIIKSLFDTENKQKEREIVGMNGREGE